MPRNMSFSLTTKQVRRKQKTVTRRFGWDFLKPGDIVNAVEKAMGLKKGEKVRHICQIRIVSIRKQEVFRIDEEDCAKEGFPGMKRTEFVSFLREHTGCKLTDLVNRIEFEYID